MKKPDWPDKVNYYSLTSDMFIDQSKDWYYVSGYTGHGPGQTKEWHRVVVFAKNLKEAKQKTTEWVYLNKIVDVSFYRNNYKPDSRQLVREGKVIK